MMFDFKGYLKALRLRITPPAMRKYTAMIVDQYGVRITARAYGESYGGKWNTKLHRFEWSGREGAEWYAYARNNSHMSDTMALPRGTQCVIERIY